MHLLRYMVGLFTEARVSPRIPIQLTVGTPFAWNACFDCSQRTILMLLVLAAEFQSLVEAISFTVFLFKTWWISSKRQFQTTKERKSNKEPKDAKIHLYGFIKRWKDLRSFAEKIARARPHAFQPLKEDRLWKSLKKRNRKLFPLKSNKEEDHKSKVKLAPQRNETEKLIRSVLKSDRPQGRRKLGSEER